MNRPAVRAGCRLRGSCRIEIPRQDLAGIDQPPVERPDTGIRRTSC